MTNIAIRWFVRLCLTAVALGTVALLPMAFLVGAMATDGGLTATTETIAFTIMALPLILCIAVFCVLFFIERHKRCFPYVAAFFAVFLVVAGFRLDPLGIGYFFHDLSYDWRWFLHRT